MIAQGGLGGLDERLPVCAVVDPGGEGAQAGGKTAAQRVGDWGGEAGRLSGAAGVADQPCLGGVAEQGLLVLRGEFGELAGGGIHGGTLSCLRACLRGQDAAGAGGALWRLQRDRRRVNSQSAGARPR